MMMSVVVWSAIWSKRRKQNGLEHVVVRNNTARSVILGLDDEDRAFRIDYTIEWDEQWRTREVQLEIELAGAARNMQLIADGRGTWRDAERAIPELAGCIDVDIWPTPFTNTLPIRRLHLQMDQRAEIEAAWVNAFEGSVRKAQQAYTRTGERRYLYEGLDSGFRAELEVDEFGLITDYPGVFTRLRAPD